MNPLVLPFAAVMLIASARADAGIPVIDPVGLAQAVESVQAYLDSPEGQETARQIAAEKYNREKAAALQRARAQGAQPTPGRSAAGKAAVGQPIPTTSIQGEMR